MQRRRDRAVIFRSDRSCLTYVEALLDLRHRLGLKLYGYCLMPNHVHVIVEPGAQAETMRLFMTELAGLAGSTTQAHVRRHIPESIVESQFYAVPIRSDKHLLACAVYVDRNPAKGRYGKRPEDHLWSGYRFRIGLSTRVRLDTPLCFLRLGRTVQEQQRAYRDLVESGRRHRRK
jgi:putative transposase